MSKLFLRLLAHSVLALGACSYSAGEGGNGSAGSGNAGAGGTFTESSFTSIATEAVVTEGDHFFIQLSADDSTSMASAQITKLEFAPNPALHRHEFTNYYDPPRELFAAEPWALVAEPTATIDLGVEIVNHAPTETAPGSITFVSSLQADPIETAARRAWNLVYCVDVSGSMQGEKMAFVRQSLLASLARLRDGDRITLVTFSTDAALIFDDLAWPADESTIRAAFSALEATDSTNMIAGLRLAYERARAHHAGGALTRVLLFGDGDANVGILDIAAFRDETRIGDEEGIYLSSVGVGFGFDWTRMDQLADAGKGASVFLPNAAEAMRLFGTEQFTKLVEIAADEVDVELELPVGLTLVDFSGEEVSTDPNRRVPTVVLASGDDLTMLARFSYTDAAVLDAPMTIRVTMRPLGTGEITTFEQTFASVSMLFRDGGDFYRRATIVDDYANVRIGNPDAPSASSIVAAIDAFPTIDWGLAEIRALVGP